MKRRVVFLLAHAFRMIEYCSSVLIQSCCTVDKGTNVRIQVEWKQFERLFISAGIRFWDPNVKRIDSEVWLAVDRVHFIAININRNRTRTKTFRNYFEWISRYKKGVNSNVQMCERALVDCGVKTVFPHCINIKQADTHQHHTHTLASAHTLHSLKNEPHLMVMTKMMLILFDVIIN